MKRKLLDAMAETREKEADLEALVVDAPPDPTGRWRVQDHLSHLAWFREWDAALIDAVLAGDEIPPDLPEGQNEKIYEATRQQPASEVVANAHRSWERIVAAVEGLSEEDLERPHPHREGRKLVDGTPSDHLGAHLMWCHLEAGDEAAAEAVQLWARELSGRLFDDPHSRGVASYNLGCFYARVGRAPEAVALLGEGFEGAPELRKWALEDPDLDPIRQDPLFLELVGTQS